MLAAGFGTRLRPLTEAVPKPLVPVCGVPLLAWSLALCARHELREVIVKSEIDGLHLVQRGLVLPDGHGGSGVPQRIVVLPGRRHRGLDGRRGVLLDPGAG